MRSSGWGGTLHYSKDAAYVDHRPRRHHTCAFTCSWLCLYLNMAVVRACPSLSTPPSADKVWPLAHIAVSVVVRADGWRVCGWEVLTHSIFCVFQSASDDFSGQAGFRAAALRKCAVRGLHTARRVPPCGLCVHVLSQHGQGSGLVLRLNLRSGESMFVKAPKYVPSV